MDRLKKVMIPTRRTIGIDTPRNGDDLAIESFPLPARSYAEPGISLHEQFDMYP